MLSGNFPPDMKEQIPLIGAESTFAKKNILRMFVQNNPMNEFLEGRYPNVLNLQHKSFDLSINLFNN